MQELCAESEAIILQHCETICHDHEADSVQHLLGIALEAIREITSFRISSGVPLIEVTPDGTNDNENILCIMRVAALSSQNKQIATSLLVRVIYRAGMVLFQQRMKEQWQDELPDCTFGIMSELLNRHNMKTLPIGNLFLQLQSRCLAQGLSINLKSHQEALLCMLRQQVLTLQAETKMGCGVTDEISGDSDDSLGALWD